MSTDASTASSLQVFSTDEFELKIYPDGDSFRVQAPGFARALGFGSARDMLRSVPDAEKGMEVIPTQGGDQRAWYVTEAGFYRVLGQRQTSRIKDESAREAAVRFQDWIYHEVLPALRRVGTYEISVPAPRTEVAIQLPQTYEEALADLLESVRDNKALMEAKRALMEANYEATYRIMELEPRAAQADLYLSADNLINIRSVARDVQQWYAGFGKEIRQKDIFDFMHVVGLLIQRDGGLEHNQATAFAIKNGYAQNYTHLVTRSDLSTEKVKVARLTPAGEAFFWNRLYTLVGEAWSSDFPKLEK